MLAPASPRIPVPVLLAFAVLVVGAAPPAGALTGRADDAAPAALAEPAAAAPHAPAAAPAPAAPDPVEELVATAHDELSRYVRRMSHPDALRLALRAYYNYRAARPHRVRKPYLFFVDYGLDNRTARGYVFDMDRLELVDGPFTVAHGSGSSRSRNGVPTRFSNRPGSKATSLGLYVAQETYTFHGRAGGRAYTSVGLRLDGESDGFNDAARRRRIVAHGAPYVTRRDAGRSEGCPAIEPRRARRLLPLLANGGVVFLFSPLDTRWLRHDPWINAGG
ncbi:MAG TPA: murein L,D-transpeptidase catalytic domain family protein [Longimicrobiales bacterium]